LLAKQLKYNTFIN